MCGRYSLYTDQEIADIDQIVREVSERFHEEIKTGEVYPTNRAPVLLDEGAGIHPEPLVWGFPSFKGSGVIINARAETAGEKPTFRASLQECRCAVPTTGFFEWTRDKAKQKYRFTLAGTGALYLAGLYRDYPDGRRFVILTTAANPSVADVHDRMPVILCPGELAGWTRDRGEAERLLRREPPLLTRAAV